MGIPQFSSVETIKLIGLVKQFTILYDQNHPKYFDMDMREEIWRNIATQMNAPGKKKLQAIKL